MSAKRPEVPDLEKPLAATGFQDTFRRSIERPCTGQYVNYIYETAA